MLRKCMSNCCTQQVFKIIIIRVNLCQRQSIVEYLAMNSTTLSLSQEKINVIYAQRFQTSSCDERLTFQTDYNEHIERKSECQSAKTRDKLKACEDKNFFCATFDLQAVLQIPSNDVSQMYYSRKLCVYNLTIYNAAPPNEAFCYTWNETDGGRGSNEIGTCLLKWIRSLPTNVTELSLFSDTCGGQNRNKQIATALVYAVQTTHVTIIHQKFLERGHSQMEVDSMHSAIESAKRNVAVYTMIDWLNIFRSARRRNPCTVQQLSYADIDDLKQLSKIYIR